MSSSSPLTHDHGARSGGAFRKVFRKVIHVLSYRFIYEQHRTRSTRAAGLRLTVGPTVFHPRWFLTSEYFAGYIDGLDLEGQQVADVGTGSGILALAAARSGASRVVAIDVNPNAARSASDNAQLNGFQDRVSAVCSDLLAALAPRPTFDLILSSPPSFPGEPLDLADRAWHAGPRYSGITKLFDQARERLLPNGRLLLLLSSDSDIGLLRGLAERAGFGFELVGTRSMVLEQFLLFELRFDPDLRAGRDTRQQADQVSLSP